MNKNLIAIFFLCFLGTACVQQNSAIKKTNEKEQRAIQELAIALSNLPESGLPVLGEQTPTDNNKENKEEILKEATLIARALVTQTYETNKKFKMKRNPYWHNFLVKIGRREGGYCYQWVPELLGALPQIPLRYFERRWGGSYLSFRRENNAVIISRRGAPMETGIVYDAWRGAGKPFWKIVKEDKKYPWVERFNESEILMGDAQVEPL